AARVRFVDVPGGTGAQGLAQLREADALSIVLRAFGPAANPAGELAEVTADLLLADMGVVETALEGARRRAKSRGAHDVAEVATLERAQSALADETPLAEAGLGEEERKALRGLAPLTLKPWVLVANVEEGAGVPTE